MYASELIMTAISTTNLDAISIGKPVLMLAFKKNVFMDSRRPQFEKYGPTL